MATLVDEHTSAAIGHNSQGLVAEDIDNEEASELKADDTLSVGEIEGANAKIEADLKKFSDRRRELEANLSDIARQVGKANNSAFLEFALAGAGSNMQMVRAFIGLIAAGNGLGALGGPMASLINLDREEKAYRARMGKDGPLQEQQDTPQKPAPTLTAPPRGAPGLLVS